MLSTLNMSARVADGLINLPTDAKDDMPNIDPDDEADNFDNVIGRSGAKKPLPSCLRSGSWLVEYKVNDNSATTFDGILRVDYGNASGINYASGDLFQRKKATDSPFIPKPQDGIPVMPLSQYSYFLQTISLKSGSTDAGSVEMGFNLRKYSRPTGDKGGEGTWSKDAPHSTILNRAKAPEDFPSSSDFYKGDVKASGQVVATIQIGWISKYYRKVSLEIATVAGVKPPLDNGSIHSWRSVFATAGVDLTVIVDTPAISEPANGTWTPAELYAAMLKSRGKVDLEFEARFYLLVVKKINGKAMERGVMFDFGGASDTKKAREGAAVATDWVIPKTGWGTVAGQKWGSVPGLIFRSAVHEIGHAMNLKHSSLTQTFMDSSDQIAEFGGSMAKFPDNIKWSFDEKDIDRIHHLPEISFRPGGRPIGARISL